jgi:hypothetical protein
MMMRKSKKSKKRRKVLKRRNLSLRDRHIIVIRIIMCIMKMETNLEFGMVRRLSKEYNNYYLENV